jgi:hypothetical protein
MKSFLRVLFIHPGIDEKSAAATLERGTANASPHCSFTVVSNCFLALEQLETNHFDIIILQKDLKSFPSLSFTNIMKHLNLRIPVIFLLRRNCGVHSRELSPENVLSYPFSFSSLRRALFDAASQIVVPCTNIASFQAEVNLKLETKKEKIAENGLKEKQSSGAPNNRRREHIYEDFQLNDLASFESLVDLPKEDEFIFIRSEIADYYHRQQLEVLDEDFHGDDSISDQSGFMNEDDSFDLMSLDEGSNNESFEDLSEWRATLFRNIDDAAIRSPFEKLSY